MISAYCPYCDHSIWLSIGDRRTPFWGHIECDGCGKTFWEEYSRICPRALTEEAFAEVYEVNEETRAISEKPKPPVDPLVKAMADRWRDELMAEFTDRILYGEPPSDPESQEYKEWLETRERYASTVSEKYGVPDLLLGKEENAD